MRAFLILSIILWVSFHSASSAVNVGVSTDETAERSTVNREAALEDLAALKKIMLSAHFDPFGYISRDEFEAAFEREREFLKSAKITALSVHGALQRFAGSIKNGHTDIFFPIQRYLSYADEGGVILPIEVALENGKALIRANFSGDPRVHQGAELISINGRPLAQILEKIGPQISAERPYFKHAKIELFTLPRLYWQAFGAFDSFDIVLSDPDQSGQSTAISLKGVKIIDGYEAKRIDILSHERTVRFISNDIAYLSPGTFSGDQKSYENFVEGAFAEIKAKAVDILIIDLCNNGGGDDAFSDYLVSYIADKPFQWNGGFRLKTSTPLKEHTRKTSDLNSAYARAILSHEDGEIFDFKFEDTEPQPIEKRFNGTVYALVNRQSHSQAAVTAAQIQDYGWANIVGEETGEYPSLLASIFPVTLPNSGLTVNISKGEITRVNGDKSAKGVIPDLFIKDHLLDQTDEILDGLLKQLTNK